MGRNSAALGEAKSILDVALYARAWVEIKVFADLDLFGAVALYARAWVEMHGVLVAWAALLVALYARAWVEISARRIRTARGASSPSMRERG